MFKPCVQGLSHTIMGTYTLYSRPNVPERSVVKVVSV